MTELLTRSPWHSPPNQRVSVSSGEVWATDYRPWVDRAPAWLPTVIARVEELVGRDLATRRAAAYLVALLQDSLWADTPQPFVSATEEKFLAAEFEGGSLHFSVEATPSGDLSVYVADGHWDWEGSLEDLPDGVEKWAWRISHV